jgi:hypothetical protein
VDGSVLVGTNMAGWRAAEPVLAPLEITWLAPGDDV